MFAFFRKWFLKPEPELEAPAMSELEGLIAENLKLGAQIDTIRKRRIEIREKIDALHAIRDNAQGRG
jgi:hypothetical protein